MATIDLSRRPQDLSRRRRGRARASTSPSPTASSSCSSGPPAAASPRCCAWSPGSRRITAGTVSIGGTRGQRARAGRARHRHGVPELRALPAHERAARTSPTASRTAARRRPRSTTPRRRGRPHPRDRRRSSTASRAQLSGGQRQRVAMGRAIVREPEGLPVRRAALQPRRQAARPDARSRSGSCSARLEDHHALRHPRPARGDDAGRPAGGDERRPDRADRHAARALREAGLAVRRRLHRLARR